MSTFRRNFLHLVALTDAWADANPGADTRILIRTASLATVEGWPALRPGPTVWPCSPAR